MATDPVCGMWVDEGTSTLRLVRDNRTYHFCSESCLQQFADPAVAGRDLARRLTVAWPLAIVVAVLIDAVGTPPALVAAAGLAAIVQVYAGFPFYRGTLDAVRSRSWNMDLLIAVGSTAAFAYSAAALALPSRLPHDYYFDASALILALILTGNYLEHRTRARAGSALRRLGEVVPRTALVLREGRETDVPVGELRVGDRVRVRPGGRFPADGVVRAGATSVDESLMTGESTPVRRSVGDRVLAGSIGLDGLVEIETTSIATDTFVAQVGRLLAAAEMSRVPLKRTADRIAGGFVPAVLGLGLAAGLFWATVGGGGLTVGVLAFVTVVIAACPCAFGIATPAAIVVGTGRAADAGILFRGEESLERAATVDVVVTDKTGTLTAGRPVLAGVRATAGTSEDALLAAAAAVERGSEHPFARAVEAAARARGLAVPPATDLRVEPGRGVSGTVDRLRVEVLGADLRSGSLPDDPTAGAVDAWAGGGASVSWVRREGRTIGALAFSDPVAPGSAPAVAALRADGVPVIMATGDLEGPARSVAATVGIDEVHAGLRPAEKLELLERLRASGRRVAYVGDGINDAPAIAAADLGIAIGTGTDVAREAGGVLLVRSDLGGVPLALRIARRTVRKVRSNLAWAIGYNALLLPIAAGVLVPWFGFGIYASLPVLGAVAMAVSSTSVVLNSLSLRWVELGPRGHRVGAGTKTL